jgi:murein DD-endopeptidase MepM/ murein hydrolase activator NlpD
MRKRSSRPSRIVGAASSVGFLAIAAALVVWGFPGLMHLPKVSGQHLANPPPTAKPPIPSSTETPIIEVDAVAELRDRRLELPVQGAVRQELRDSFYDTRGSTRGHEAIDMMAPRNTPILAVEDGTIARLFESVPGGTTVYQFDPAARYAYYYAHLERYADGLHEGQHVQRRQVLGYVGTSGNAPKNTPHLHFAIFRLTEKKQWWRGSPVDPYEVLK